jgi:hypothetical protein
MLLAVVLSACDLGPTDESGDGGSAGSGSVGGCAAPTGQYLLSYQETTGTCGAQYSTSLVFGNNKAALTAGCTGEFRSDASGCHDTFDIQCPLTGQVVERAGTLDWTSDGKSAQGSITVSLSSLTTDGSGIVIATTPVCSSRYTVSLIKT